MTIEQAKSELMQIYGALNPDKQRAIDTLVKIEPCEDAISRQAANEIINDIRDCISVEGYWAILERLKKLPSVKQEPKTQESEKINCKSTKCENCTNHNCCDYESQESEEV